MNINELFTDGLNFAVSFLRLFTNFTRTMNVQLISADDVHQICRSCLCKGDKLIPLDVPYNHVVNTKYDCVNAAETIGELLMACGNIHVSRIYYKGQDSILMQRCQRHFMTFIVDHGRRWAAAECVHKMFYEHSCHFRIQTDVRSK